MGKKIEGLETVSTVSAWWLVSAPVDFRCGADRLLVHVREALGRDSLDGSADQGGGVRTETLGRRD